MVRRITGAPRSDFCTMSHIPIPLKAPDEGSAPLCQGKTMEFLRNRKKGLEEQPSEKPLPEARLAINTRRSSQLPSMIFFSFTLSLSFHHFFSLHALVAYQHCCPVCRRESERKRGAFEGAARGSLLISRILPRSTLSSVGVGLGKPAAAPVPTQRTTGFPCVPKIQPARPPLSPDAHPRD